MHRQLTRTALLASILALVAVGEADAQWVRHTGPQNQVRFRLGLFEPIGGADGWDSVFEGFSGTPSDLQDFVWGTDFLWRTGRNTGVLFGFSYFNGKTTSSYLDWVAGDGSEVRHTTRLETSDATAAFVYLFGGAGVRPYLGAGGGFLWYTLTDEGNFIDFGQPEQPVIWAWYGARGTTIEAFALAGVDVPLGSWWSFFVEGRYRWAEDTLGDDFAGFGDLDLSGVEISGGFAIRF